MSRKLLGYGGQPDLNELAPNEELVVIDADREEGKLKHEQPSTNTLEVPYWEKSVDEVFNLVGSTINGLTNDEAYRRLERFGPNSLPEPEEEGLLSQLMDAFKDPLALILTVSAFISATVGLIGGETENLQNALLIMGIVVFMVLVGYFTDLRAGNALKKLKLLQQTFTNVARDGKVQFIESSQLVLGDVIYLREGDKVPADARVVNVVNALVNEKLITGEPFAIAKSVAPITKLTALAERFNMVVAGTAVEGGTLTAVITGTGVNTELGKISEKIETADEGLTPLQQQLDQLGKVLLYGTLILCIVVVGVYIFRGTPILDALIDAVSLAIAFIPEALGAVVTIALALGVNEMVKKGAIIKQLRAAEALGSVSVICTDKTGTITRGEMRATEMWTAGKGRQNILTADPTLYTEPHIQRLLTIAQLCNDLGNPTEKALQEIAALAGLEVTADTRTNRVYEQAFNSTRKMMTVGHRTEGGRTRLYSKGAPDRLIDRCTYVLANGDGVIPMTPAIAITIREAVREFEQEGARVLVFADKDLDELNTDDKDANENELVFVGVVAFSDPPRVEVEETVNQMRAAGITAKMITGDSKLTALSIAKKVGIVFPDEGFEVVMLGNEIDELMREVPEVNDLKDKQLERIVSTKVFARTSPEQKIYLVKAHQKAGMLVGMAGDGVNDAPSLKQANVGIAMNGATDITKDTAAVVLTGTYQAIAAAVEVGRTILQRTRLYTHALLSTNGAEVLMFIVAVVLGWLAPFSAVQLLLINLLGDSWLSIALATEKAEDDTMQQPPRNPKESIITPYMYASIALQSVVTTIMMALGWIIARDYAMTINVGPEQTLVLQQTTIFSVFMTQKVLRSAFTARSLKFNLWQIGVFSNRWSLLAALLTIAMAVGALYIPIFGMTVLPSALLSVLSLGLVPPLVEEVVKFGRRIIHGDGEPHRVKKLNSVSIV